MGPGKSGGNGDRFLYPGMWACGGGLLAHGGMHRGSHIWCRAHHARDNPFNKTKKISAIPADSPPFDEKNIFFRSKMWDLDGQGPYGGRSYANVVHEIIRYKINEVIHGLELTRLWVQPQLEIDSTPTWIFQKSELVGTWLWNLDLGSDL